MELGEEQRRAVEQAVEGKNLFVTGGAGTGKSVTLREMVKRLRELGKRVVVTASTGVTAENVNGITLHKWARCGLPSTVMDFMKMLENKDLSEADVLVLDEVCAAIVP